MGNTGNYYTQLFDGWYMVYDSNHVRRGQCETYVQASELIYELEHADEALSTGC